MFVWLLWVILFALVLIVVFICVWYELFVIVCSACFVCFDVCFNYLILVDFLIFVLVYCWDWLGCDSWLWVICLIVGCVSLFVCWWCRLFVFVFIAGLFFLICCVWVDACFVWFVGLFVCVFGDIVAVCVLVICCFLLDWLLLVSLWFCGGLTWRLVIVLGCALLAVDVCFGLIVLFGLWVCCCFNGFDYLVVILVGYYVCVLFVSLLVWGWYKT